MRWLAQVQDEEDAAAEVAGEERDMAEGSASDLIKGVATHDESVLEGLLRARLDNMEASGLDARAYSLVCIASLIALDAAPASYLWQIGLALESGVSAEEILGVLVAVNPIVGNARTVAAAAEVALGLGIELDEEEG